MLQLRKGVRAPAVGRRAGGAWEWRAPGPWDLFQVLPSWLCPVTSYRWRTGWAGLEASYGNLQTRRDASFCSGRGETYRGGRAAPCGRRGPVGWGLCSLLCLDSFGRELSFCDVQGSVILRGRDSNHTFVWRLPRGRRCSHILTHLILIAALQFRPAVCYPRFTAWGPEAQREDRT